MAEVATVTAKIAKEEKLWKIRNEVQERLC
jgi:hypothetical protein